MVYSGPVVGNIVFAKQIRSFFAAFSAQAIITITPSNTELEPYPIPDPPDGPGGQNLIFSFDLEVSDPDGASAMSFQSTLGVDLPGLIFDDAYYHPVDPCDPCAPPNPDPWNIETAQEVSEMVADDSDYWLFDNSGELMLYIGFEGSNQFDFGDFADDFELQALAAGDIVARYSFIWDGTPGDYTFTLDLDPGVSFFVFDPFDPQGEGTYPIAFDHGSFPGDSDSFTVTLVPEPATLVLLGLGGFMIRKRRA